MSLNMEKYEEKIVHSAGRFKVCIQCNECGEKYYLRGIRDKHGEIETGFKMCVCGNATNLRTTSAD